MKKNCLICEALPNIPWQDRPQGSDEIIWRYSENPVIGRNPQRGVARIYNSAVLPKENKFVGIFRADTITGLPDLYYGESDDGIHFRFSEKPIRLIDENGNIVQAEYRYDPRLTKIEDTYYITWCDGYHNAPTIGLASTKDFVNYKWMERATLPFNRNGVLFPEKIGGEYAMLTRPSDNSHTAFGDIYISYSKDLIYWGKFRRVMNPGREWWQCVKIGAGPVPIKTTEGWLLIYHGVSSTCNGFVYSMGGAILDLNDPRIVKYRCKSFLLTPEKNYETNGFVPNVVFPCSVLADGDTGRLAIYYGAADTCTSLAFAEADALVAYIKENNVI